MKVAGRNRVPGGWQVTIEHENAYTDGTSRFEFIHLSNADVEGKTREQLLDAVQSALADPLAQVLGADPTSPISDTKALWEARMVSLYEDWQRWKNTRIEAQARGLPAAAITALSNKEDAVWANYLNAIQRWRAAT